MSRFLWRGPREDEPLDPVYGLALACRSGGEMLPRIARFVRDDRDSWPGSFLADARGFFAAFEGSNLAAKLLPEMAKLPPIGQQIDEAQDHFCFTLMELRGGVKPEYGPARFVPIVDRAIAVWGRIKALVDEHFALARANAVARDAAEAAARERRATVDGRGNVVDLSAP